MLELVKIMGQQYKTIHKVFYSNFADFLKIILVKYKPIEIILCYLMVLL